MRYSNNEIIETKPTVQYPKVVRYRSSTLYPSIPLSEDDIYTYAVFGDRLDILASQYYNDSSLWWIISIANPDLPNDSLYPTPGFQLRIPNDITTILNEFERLNS